MLYWNDSLQDTELLQNKKESSDRPFSTNNSECIDDRIAEDSKCMCENISNNLQISISS